MMRSKFDEQLDRLNKEMMKMGSAIEDSIRKAVDALVKQDAELAKKVMLQDEEIDRGRRLLRVSALIFLSSSSRLPRI